MSFSPKIRMLDDLQPTEATDPLRQMQVMDLVLRAGLWTAPIVVDEQTSAIMDGHHRYETAKALGFHSIPVVEMPYRDVRVEARRPGVDVSISEIQKRAQSGNLYPPKTTRHIFPGEVEPCSISFYELKQSKWDDHCELVWLRHQQYRGSSMEAAE